MRRVMYLVLGVALLLGAATPEARGATVVVVHRLEGMIHGVSAQILEHALSQAAQDRAALFILELDTPGGLVDATEDMVRSILNSPVPVAVFVCPRGAHAASAGFFLLLAADVAAMAPVTRTGASSPIMAGGENKEGDVALKKASEDLAALLRSAARARGRPADVAEQAVKEARSWTADEALSAKLIDVIAESRDELVKKLDGREIQRPDGSRMKLSLAGAEVKVFRPDWLEDMKNVVLHPTVMALMLAIAVLGIYVEFTHPGLILPGAAGAVALLIFLYGTRVLPVRYLAAALVAVGVVLFILEIKVVSYGALAVGGAVAVGLGLWLLFPGDVPGLRVPLGALVPIFLTMVGVIGFVTWLVARTHRLRPTTGAEGLVGAEGETTSALAPEGTVFVHGEIWRARSAEPLPAGVPVRVLRSEGLLLYVERAAPGSPGAARRV